MRRWRALLAVALVAGFFVPVASSAAAPERHPADVRVLAWNIFHGGREPDPSNLDKLLDQVVALAPDVFFSVETYGSGERIRQALSTRAGKGRYSGVQITAPGKDPASPSDNLWLFTRYPIVEVFAKPTGGQVSDFHLGGARVRLPHGRQVNLLTTWLSYTNPWDGYLIDDIIAGRRAGQPPRHTPADVAHAERVQTSMITDIISRQLPSMLRGNTDPVLMGGDLNTVPAADWDAAWAACKSHFGLSFPLRATKVVTEAGFVDTYRAANPDVCAAEGGTWSPLPAERMIAPARIDFIFAKGPVRVRESTVIDKRMRHHGPGVFYSDHAAVLSDITVPA